jgi:hypothetical protein
MPDIRHPAADRRFRRRIGYDGRTGSWPAHAEPDPVRGAVLLGTGLPVRLPVGQPKPDGERKPVPDSAADRHRNVAADRHAHGDLSDGYSQHDGKPVVDGHPLARPDRVGIAQRDLKPHGNPVRHNVGRQPDGQRFFRPDADADADGEPDALKPASRLLEPQPVSSPVPRLPPVTAVARDC